MENNFNIEDCPNENRLNYKSRSTTHTYDSGIRREEWEKYWTELGREDEYISKEKLMHCLILLCKYTGWTYKDVCDNVNINYDDFDIWWDRNILCKQIHKKMLVFFVCFIQDDNMVDKIEDSDLKKYDFINDCSCPDVDYQWGGYCDVISFMSSFIREHPPSKYWEDSEYLEAVRMLRANRLNKEQE